MNGVTDKIKKITITELSLSAWEKRSLLWEAISSDSSPDLADFVWLNKASMDALIE